MLEIVFTGCEKIEKIFFAIEYNDLETCLLQLPPGT